MKLYTCGQRASVPAMHPCGKAAAELSNAGHDFVIETVPGYRLLPWTRRGDARAEVRRLSGQDNVPILVLDDGAVITGTGPIVRWARAHPAS